MNSPPTPETARTILEILSMTAYDFDRTTDISMVTFRNPVFIGDRDHDVVAFEQLMKLMPSITIEEVRPVIFRVNYFMEHGWFWSGVYTSSEVDAVALTASLDGVALSELNPLATPGWTKSRKNQTVHRVSDVLAAFSE